MSGNAGLSQSQVRGIAEQVVVQALGPVNERIAQVSGQLDQLGRRVATLEEEMSAIGNAIASMHREVVSSLRAGFGDVARGIDHQRQEVSERTQRVEAAVEVGLAATTAATAVVGRCVDTVASKVDKGTLTAGELEYLRVFNDAKAPLLAIEAFAREVGERFNKSLEAVGEERLRNDALFSNVRENFEQKMHTIGEHIFRVYEEDFQHAVAEPLARTRIEHHELALRVDDERMEARARALDVGLEEARSGIIEPLLDTLRHVANVVATDLGVEGVPVGEVSIPFTALVGDEGVSFQHAPQAAPLLPVLKRSLGDVAHLSTRPMSESEIGAVISAMQELAKRGELDAQEADAVSAALVRDGLNVANPVSAEAIR